MRVDALIWELLNRKFGYAWPALPFISAELGLHRTTVIRAIAALRKRGWITVERRVGRYRSNLYRITFGVMPELDGEPAP